MLEKKGGQMPPVHPPGYAPGIPRLFYALKNMANIVTSTYVVVVIVCA